MPSPYTFPDTWPKAEDKRFGPTGRALPKDTLLHRVTDEMKEQLWTRQITSRELAHALNVSENYISHLFPGKAEPATRAKRELLQARRKVRRDMAISVIKQERTTSEAAALLKLKYPVMARLVRIVRKELEATQGATQ